MATPNFDPKQYIDPASLAPAFQSKASIEEEMRNNKFNRLIQAVKTGQEIANNMMDFAEKRKTQQGITSAQSIINEPAPRTTAQTSMGEVPVQPEEDTRPQRLQAALLQATGDKGALEMLRETNRSKLTNATKPTPMALELPDATQTLGYFDPLTKQYHLDNGEVAPPGTKRAFKLDLSTDASGNRKVTSGASGQEVNTVDLSGKQLTPKQVGSANSVFELPPTERQVATAAIDEYTKEPEVRKTRGAFLQSDVTMRGLSARNFVFDEKVGLQLAKTFGDSGNIAIVEQEVGRENRQLWEKGKQLLERYIKTGELTEENRIEILKAIKILRSAQLERLEREADIVVDRVTGPDGEVPRLNREKFKSKLIGPKIQEAMNKARKDLEKLPDIVTDLDVSSGSQPGQKGSSGSNPINQIKSMSLDELRARRDALLKKRG